MPPPSPPALLPSIVVFVMVAVASPKTLMAPPLPDAEGDSVARERGIGDLTSVLPVQIAPPPHAWLPENVEFVTESEPSLPFEMAPPGPQTPLVTTLLENVAPESREDLVAEDGAAGGRRSRCTGRARR